MFSLDEFDENQNHNKIQSLEILNKRVTRQQTHFFNHFKKNYVQLVQNV
jgi:inorganic pyrophosphatase